MAKLFFTHQASTEFKALPPLMHKHVTDALTCLVSDKTFGIKLWGHNDIFSVELPYGERFIYRLSGDDIQVLCMETPPQTNIAPSRLKLAAIVLAGGNNTHTKAVSLGTIADTFVAAGIDNVVMVIDHSYDNVRQEFKYRNITLVTNSERNDCLSRSLRRGLRLLAPNTDAVFLSLGNRPFITTEIITSVIRAFKAKPAPIVVPAYSHMRGHPVLFDSRLLPELMQARGNAGGRAVLARYNGELTQIEIPDAGVLERAHNN